jgi:hypothetical protein
MCSRSVYASLAKLDDHRLGGDHPRRSRGGIGLAIAGVPFAAVLTAVMFMLALAQIGPVAGAPRGGLHAARRMGGRGARRRRPYRRCGATPRAFAPSNAENG